MVFAQNYSIDGGCGEGETKLSKFETVAAFFWATVCIATLLFFVKLGSHRKPRACLNCSAIRVGLLQFSLYCGARFTSGDNIFRLGINHFAGRSDWARRARKENHKPRRRLST